MLNLVWRTVPSATAGTWGRMAGMLRNPSWWMEGIRMRRSIFSKFYFGKNTVCEVIFFTFQFNLHSQSLSSLDPYWPYKKGSSLYSIPSTRLIIYHQSLISGHQIFWIISRSLKFLKSLTFCLWILMPMTGLW